MKKKSAVRGYRVKGSGAPKNIDEYLAGVPEPACGTLKKMRATIQSALPAQATETISYGIPAFKLKKTLVYFAAFANHCSFFPTAAIIEQFKEELADYTISKGTVQFPVDRPMPATLVKKMVRARVAEHDQKESKKKNR
jgi:uncharacterized protein YdhG (YjbR/CyaY superfamily)